MAAQAVFATPELLESILLHLPAREILASHRVSKTFHGTTQGSIALQRRLWTVSRRLPPLDDPEAPARKYNFNRLIDEHAREVGVEYLLQWNLDDPGQKGGKGGNGGKGEKGGKGGKGEQGEKEAIIIDIYWRSWAHVMDPRKRSCDHMLVVQPRRPVEVTWSVGFFEKVGGARQRERRQWSFRWEDGRLPTLGMLRGAVVERFGVVDWSLRDLEKGKGEDEGCGESGLEESKVVEV
ncbi:hypothetical protein B0A55_02170 [Friedmanniomyces simplex]|uniref:F-box domain-containing protein n=1 Tax=Friedmanniomyces simplex TaxID=329884 RepID=A0A4U0Y166_9PEZI|nr:hypothetical protein B0A55_02170 [Friedmanniomyces simplex]